MAITIDIDTARPYQVHVGTFLLEQAGPLVRATAGGTKAVIVTDTNVGPLYQMPVKQSLEASGYEVSICTFEAGEAHKRAETYVAILEFVAEHELSRSDVIVALGGGVVGDVAGFVAATYMRGCKFVQIPTSLLAMVDSSVGARPPSTWLPARTWPAPFGSRAWSLPTWGAWPPSRPSSSLTAAARSSSTP